MIYKALISNTDYHLWTSAFYSHFIFQEFGFACVANIPLMQLLPTANCH